jgi:hypothetical protein
VVLVWVHYWFQEVTTYLIVLRSLSEELLLHEVDTYSTLVFEKLYDMGM